MACLSSINSSLANVNKEQEQIRLQQDQQVMSCLNSVNYSLEHLRLRQDQLIRKQDQLQSQLLKEPVKTPLSSPSSFTYKLGFPRIFRTPQSTFLSPSLISPRGRILSPPCVPRAACSCPPELPDFENDILETIPDITS